MPRLLPVAGMPRVLHRSGRRCSETDARGRVLSVALGMPEPVAFDKDTPVALPTLPEWDRYPVRKRLASLWSAPVWMDDRTNQLALGERRVNPLAGRSEHMLYMGGGASIASGMRPPPRDAD